MKIVVLRKLIIGLFALNVFVLSLTGLDGKLPSWVIKLFTQLDWELATRLIL